MDPDVRAAGPSRCPRCGMKLVAGIPDPREFAVNLRMEPRAPRPGGPLRLTFILQDPRTGKPAPLQVIHEKLLHLFIVSADLTYFAHEHPCLQANGSFVFETKLPQSGEYRLLCDFYPESATPQLIAKTIYVPGERRAAALRATLTKQECVNLSVSMRLDPPQPLAGTKTMMFFTLDPARNLEPYLGAWGHMLAASSDLVDMIHTHPAWEDKGETIQFNLIFPRPGMHRVWVQFQSAGIVNTAGFNFPVVAI